MRRKVCVLLSIISFMAIIFTSTVFGAFEMVRTIYNNSLQIGTIQIENPTLTYLHRESATYLPIGDAAFETEHGGYSNGVLSCYATNKRDKDTETFIHINQVAVSVSFRTDIDVRLRVKIQDEWKSCKVFNSGTSKNDIITKDWKAEPLAVNPFAFAEEGGNPLWDYDVTTGYAYYNGIISGDDTNSIITKSFLIPNNYYYETSASVTGYTETVFVSLAFQIELVQANRAEKVWRVSF